MALVHPAAELGGHDHEQNREQMMAPEGVVREQRGGERRA